jgi:hypothetical protein
MTNKDRHFYMRSKAAARVGSGWRRNGIWGRCPCCNGLSYLGVCAACGWMRLCMWCGKVWNDATGTWVPFSGEVSKRASHGACQPCADAKRREWGLPPYRRVQA